MYVWWSWSIAEMQEKIDIILVKNDTSRVPDIDIRVFSHDPEQK